MGASRERIFACFHGVLQGWRAAEVAQLTAENACESWNYTSGTAELQSCAWPGFGSPNADCRNANKEQLRGEKM